MTEHYTRLFNIQSKSSQKTLISMKELDSYLYNRRNICERKRYEYNRNIAATLLLLVEKIISKIPYTKALQDWIHKYHCYRCRYYPDVSPVYEFKWENRSNFPGIGNIE